MILNLSVNVRIVKPFVRNAVVAGACAALGDFITQTSIKEQPFAPISFDVQRNLALGAFGAMWSLPGFIFYRTLAAKLPPITISQVLKGAIVSSCLFDLPVTVPCYFFITDALRGRDFPFIVEHFKHDYQQCAISVVCIWFPATIFNLRFIPLQYRVIYDSCISVVSSSVISFLANRRVKPWKPANVVELLLVTKTKKKRKIRPFSTSPCAMSIEDYAQQENMKVNLWTRLEFWTMSRLSWGNFFVCTQSILTLLLFLYFWCVAHNHCVVI